MIYCVIQKSNNLYHGITNRYREMSGFYLIESEPPLMPYKEGFITLTYYIDGEWVYEFEEIPTDNN